MFTAGACRRYTGPMESNSAFRLMIVDDQPKEIEGIRALLDWESLGIEIVGTAIDGKEGAEKACHLRPDLIITDVVMPIMDGLEMIAEIRKVLPEIKVIFISCFNDFKFTGRAIDEGACGYVLKPILPDELAISIRRALGIFEAEERVRELSRQQAAIRANLAVLRDQYVRNLLLGGIPDPADQREQARALGFSVECRFYSAVCLQLVEDPEREDTLTVLERLTAANPDPARCLFQLIDLDHIACLLRSDEPSRILAEKEFYRDCERILSLVNGPIGITAYAGLGPTVNDLELIEKSYKAARAALDHRFYGRPEVPLRADSPSVDFRDEPLRADLLESAIKDLFLASDPEAVPEFLDRFLSHRFSPPLLKYAGLAIVNAVYLDLVRLNLEPEELIGSFPDLIVGIARTDSLAALKQLLNELLRRVIVGFGPPGRNYHHDLARRIEAFIERRLTDPIQLQDVADHIFLSPGYANALYKRATGTTIHQAIQNAKMKAAERMLLERRGEKVADIAAALGYSNATYFIYAFRKSYGASPQEYRRSMVP